VVAFTDPVIARTHPRTEPNDMNRGVTDPALLLPIEIAVGGLAYVPAAFLFARPIAVDLLGVLRQLRRGRGTPVV